MDPVPGFTFADLRALVRRSAAPTTALGVLWSDEHKVTHHLVHLSQRVDRCLLLSLYEQTSQRLQIRVDKFGEVLDQSKQLPADSPVLQLAMDVMLPIAKKFVNGEIEVKDMLQLRNDALKVLDAKGQLVDHRGVGRPPKAVKAKAHGKAAVVVAVKETDVQPSCKKAKVAVAKVAVAKVAKVEVEAYVPIGEGEDGSPPSAMSVELVQRFFEF
jgi:hypothetical protein